MAADFEFQVALDANPVYQQVLDIGRRLDDVFARVRPLSLTADTAQAESKLRALDSKVIKPKIEPDLSTFGSRFDKALTEAQKKVLSLKSELAGAIVEGAEGDALKGMKLELAAAEKEARQLQNALNSVDKEIDQVNNSKINPISGGTDIGGSVLGGIIGGGVAGVVSSAISKLSEGIGQVISLGSEFEQSLAGVSAITGVTGAGLSDLGQRALDLSAKFGGSANAQLQSFQGILSRFGAQLAQTPDQLGKVSENINILAKAGGLDAAAAMDTLTNSMLQFGVDVTNADEAASESSRFINVLAASAKVGAAEIPQVGEAVLVAGVAAKQAKVSFEETNAAIQVLAAGGKVGAEAGTALRNVLGKIAGEEVIPNEALKKLKSLGVNMNIVSDTSIPLSGRLKELGKASKDATAFAQVFGTENAAAAAILAQGAGTISDWTAEITGTSEATNQAATNMATFGETMERSKSQASNFGIFVFQAVQQAFSGGGGLDFEAILGATFEALKPIVTDFAESLGNMFAILKAAFDVLVLPFQLLFDSLKEIGQAMGIFGKDSLSLSVIIHNVSATFREVIGYVSKFTEFIRKSAINDFIKSFYGLNDSAENARNGLGTTTEAVLEQSEAIKKNIEEQIKDNEQKQAATKHTQSIVKEYQELANKTKLTKEEQERLKTIQGQLDKQYPALIDQTKSYKENLDGVAEIGKSATDSLKKLGKQNDNLQKQMAESVKLIAAAKRNVAIDELRDVVGTWTLFNSADMARFKREFAKVRGAFEGSLFSAKTEEDIDAANAKILEFVNANQQVLADDPEKLTEIYEKIGKAVTASKNSVREFTGENARAVKEAAKEEKTAKTAAKSEELKDISDKVVASERALSDLKNKLGLTSIADEKKREIEAAETAKQIRLRGVQDQIDDAKKLTEVAAADKAKLIANLEARYELEKGLNTELDAVNAKYNERALTSERKQQSDLAKLAIDAQLRKIEQLTQNEAATLVNAEEIGLRRVALQRLKGEEEVRAFIEGTEQFKTAEAAITAELKLDKIDVPEALQQLKLAREQIAGNFQTGADPLSQAYAAVNAKNAADALKVEQDNAALLNKVRIDSIEDRATRERETTIAAAQKTYNEDLRQAGNNENLKYLAFKRFKLAQVEAEKEYLKQTQSLYEQAAVTLLDTLGAAIQKAFTPDRSAQEEAKKGLEELAQKEKELYKARAANSISFEDFQKQLSDLAKQEAELKDKLGSTGFSVGKAFVDAFSAALGDLASVMSASAKGSVAKYAETGAVISATNREIDALRAELGTADVARQAEITKEISALEKQRGAAARESSAVASAAYISMGLSVGATLTQMAVSGKANIGEMVIAVLDGLQALVPIFAAQIYGAMVSSPNPVNIATLGGAGLLAATGLTLGLTALVEIAKAAVRSGFYTGGYTGDFAPTETVGVVHGQEVVFEHQIVQRDKKGVLELRRTMQQGVTASEILDGYRQNRSAWFVGDDGRLGMTDYSEKQREFERSVMDFEAALTRVDLRVKEISVNMPVVYKQDNSELLREMREMNRRLEKIEAAQYETAKEYRAHTAIDMNVTTDTDVLDVKMKRAAVKNILRGG